MANPILIENNYGRLELKDSVGVLWLDLKGEPVNKISPEMLEAFSGFIEEVQKNASIKAVVMISSKKDWIAGADITMFQKRQVPGYFENLSKSGHERLDALATSKKPFVAAIDGAALGGGFEIALACHGRIVSNNRRTHVGQPEVKLGVIPAGGATQRLPRLIGIQKALDMMLTGKNIYAKRAVKWGLADRISSTDSLLENACAFAMELISNPINRKLKRPFSLWLLEGNPIGRSFMFKKAREMVTKQTLGNYPAPFWIIDCVEAGMQKGIAAGNEAEENLWEETILSKESRELVNIFFAMNAKKKNPMKELARPIKKLGMLGAGLMGSGIAEVSLGQEIEVSLKDVKQENLVAARQNIYGAFSSKMKKGGLTETELDEQMSRLVTTLNTDAFKDVDIVVEAVFEDLKLKHKVLEETEANISDQCIFASNTSALPITMIADRSKRPENVIGMHYFSPVPKMPLLEIIVTDKTADWVKATCLELGVRQGKTCIVVKDGPGFYTSRILGPYMNEALLMLEEGADILQVDKAMRQFGYPVGPFTLLDEVGIDVAAKVMTGEINKLAGTREGAIRSGVIPKLNEKGYQGRKNRLGLYMYDERTGKKQKGVVNTDVYRMFGGLSRMKLDPKEIQHRVAMQMANEAAHCLHETVIDNPLDGDIGAIFGLGFPPFRGGPFRYMDSLGTEKVLEILSSLGAKHGQRFRPSQIIIDYAAQKRKFYED